MLCSDIIENNFQPRGMECPICYGTEELTVTMPCSLAHRHTLCFKCFVLNHESSGGSCPVCRADYMTYVRGDEANKDILINGSVNYTMLNDTVIIQNSLDEHIMADMFEELMDAFNGFIGE
jgi:hypothetical protein